MKQIIAISTTLFLLVSTRAFAEDRIRLAFSAQTQNTSQVQNASKWLVDHLITESLTESPTLGPLTLVAWYDPTLSPQDDNTLVAYTITDALWTSVALRHSHPQQATAIRDSLFKIDGLGNHLQEVLFHPIIGIHHRCDEVDAVHGHLVGTMKRAHQRIQVRSFTMVDDLAYTHGHPRSFAEHAVYQALYEFWSGHDDDARQRLREVLEYPEASPPAVRWDPLRKILVDQAIANEYSQFVAGKRPHCLQATFKLALFVYAARLMSFTPGDETTLDQMQDIVWSCQHKTGGVAHFFLTDQNGKRTAAPGATAEATSIAILSESILPVEL